MAILFLRNSNQGVYGKLVHDYRKEFANNEDRYPKTLRQVVDVMRQIKPKKKKTNGSGKDRNNGNKNNKDKSDKDKESEKKGSSFAQTDDKPRCFCCGDAECRTNRCQKKDDIPRNQWYDRTKKMHHQIVNEPEEDKPKDNSEAPSDSELSSETSEEDETSEGIIVTRREWSNVQVSHIQKESEEK